MKWSECEHCGRDLIEGSFHDEERDLLFCNESCQEAWLEAQKQVDK